MCMLMAVGAMAAVGAVSSIAGQRDQAKQLGAMRAQQKAQAQEMVKQLNYEYVALDQQKKDAYDQAVATLQDSSINAIRNQGMLEAAFSESGVEGRSVDAVLRETRGQHIRYQDAVRADFENTARGIEYQKETGALSTNAAIKGMPRIEGPSGFTQALGVINGGLQGAAAGASMYGAYSAATAPKAPKTGANTGY